jgi:hypothetical protein
VIHSKSLSSSSKKILIAKHIYYRVATSVIKPGPARRVDPGPGPVRVRQKTGLRKKPVKPGRPGLTRVRPGVYINFIERSLTQGKQKES